MNGFSKLIRLYSRLRFKLLDLATIKDLPTGDFNRLIESLIAAEWTPVGEYQGFDAWIDYGRVTLLRGATKLTLEWDHWTEGSIEGPRGVVQAIAEGHGLVVADEWRWSIHDE